MQTDYPEKKFIPYVDLAKQFEIDRDEVLAVVDHIFSRGNFVGGKEIEELEIQLARFCDTKYAVALNSGTDALILGLRALNIGPGDEVITPPNSFIASTGAVVAVGATPVFADVQPDQNIDPEAIKTKITPNTKAIMPVHLTGRICNMDPIKVLAQKHGIHIIEDAAQAIGSKYKGQMSGSFGTVGCFSTHPLKNLGTWGDGGFITTSDQGIAEKIRRFRNHGLIDRDTATEFGFVSRMDTFQAAILLFKLKKLNSVIKRRRINAKIYQKHLDRSFVFPPDCLDYEFNTFHTFVIQTEKRNSLMKYLAKEGIGSGIHYPVPIHLQPAALKLGHKLGAFPNTEEQANRILTIPINEFMTDTDVFRVVKAINDFTTV